MAKMLPAIIAACVAGGILVAAAVTLGGGPDAQEAPEAQDTRMVAYASFFPYYEFTRAVAGDAAHVIQFQPPGVDAHDWEPTASQVADLAEARVFVYNGLGVEAYVERLRESGEFTGAFVNAGGDPDNYERLDEDDHDEDDHESERGHEDEDDHGEGKEDDHESERGHEDEDDHGEGKEDDHESERGHEDEDDHEGEDEHGHAHGEFEVDPHIWLDPVLAKDQVDRISEGLSRADPQNADVYARNAAEFKSDLDDLHAEISSKLAQCDGRAFMVMHAAFGYFADRYDLEELPVGGLAPEAAPSAARVAAAVDAVTERGVPVFYAEAEDPRMAEAIASEAGTEPMRISTLEAPGDTTYIDRMQDNADALAVALNCR